MHLTLTGVPLPKIDQKPIENRSEIDPKTVPNRSQIGPKSVQDRLRNRPRCQHRLWTVLEPFSGCFGPALGGLLAASRGSSWGQVGLKLDFWRSWMAFKNEHDAGYLSEPIFGRFRGDFGVQNRSKIDPRAIQNPSQFASCFRSFLGSIFDRLLVDFRPPNPPRTD